MNEENIILDLTPTGIVCKVSCPKCKSVRTLSHSGKYFGISNFKCDYYGSHKEKNKLDASMKDPLAIKTGNVHLTDVAIKNANQSTEQFELNDTGECKYLEL